MMRYGSYKANHPKITSQLNKLGVSKLSVTEEYRREYYRDKLEAGKRLTSKQTSEWEDLEHRRRIQDMIGIQLAQEEASTLPKPKNPTRPVGTKKQEDKLRNERMGGWNFSVQGLSIFFRGAFAYGNLYFQDVASTDRVKTKIDGIRAGASLGASLLSFIPVYGPALASTFSLAEQIVMRRITNGIQRRGDKNRIAYNFANYDLGKYGTYAYDNTSQEWIAQDANKVKARSLGQKQSV